MRIYEGEFAYEVEPVIDPATQVSDSWRYNIYRIRPAEQLLRSGNVSTKEEAASLGKRLMEEIAETERRVQENDRVA